MTSRLEPAPSGAGPIRSDDRSARAQDLLRLNEEALNEAQKIAQIGSFLFDVESGSWTASAAFDDLLGIDQHYDHTFPGWVQRIHPDDRNVITAAMSDVLAGHGARFDQVFRVTRHSNGAERWVHGLARAEYSELGHPLTIHGTVQDITRDKLREMELQESRELMQLFVENAPAALAMLDRDLCNVAVSRRWLELHHLNAEDIIGQPHEFAFPQMPPKWKEAHRRALQGERFRVEAERLLRPDGMVIWRKYEVLPWHAGDGQVGGILIFIEDVTEIKQAEAALRESKELLLKFVEHAPAALAMFDRRMRYLAVSKRWMDTHYTGTEASIIGRSHYDLFPNLPEEAKIAHLRGLDGETRQKERELETLPDGSQRWSRWEVHPWWNAAGDVGGILIYFEDVTQYVQATEKQKLAAQVFSNVREGILITDLDGSIVEVNDSFTRITGYARNEVIGRNPRFLNAGIQSQEFYSGMYRTLQEKGLWSGELWNRRKNGSIFAEALTITALRDEQGLPGQYIGLFADITRQKENERQLEHVAHYDVLTGLPNRALLADRMHQAMAQAQRTGRPLAVAYLDLDGFKAVNDTHGHAAGDQLLTSLSARMKHALRQGDTLARLGGDEFVAVLVNLDDTEHCSGVLQRLLDAAAEPTDVAGLPLRVSASLGVSFYPQAEDVDADQLLRQADQAMYHAKLSGRNCFHIFDHSLDRNVRGHHEDIELIRKALRAGEFVLFYQPWVNMRTGEVKGVEALIRWQHPQRGLLPPAMFLPVVEEHPLAIEMGEWVIATALDQLQAWNRLGLDLRLGLNVGAMQLQAEGFAAQLAAQIAAHPGVRPAQIEIEVLETSALEDVVQVSNVINACREIGVSFALDDFGTGYSSLTYLKRLPTRVLKIDQSFVRGILDDADDLTIIEGVLGLANAFSRQVIAEGVETVAHGKILLYLGCEMAQGFGIAHPMPAGKIPAWTAEWQPDPEWTSAAVVPPADRPLLYAGVEHEAWIQGAEAFLRGERRLAPVVAIEQCRFGQWLQQGALERGGQTAIKIDALHRQLHRRAEEILDLHESGRTLQALAAIDDLRRIRDTFFDAIWKLSQQPA